MGRIRARRGRLVAVVHVASKKFSWVGQPYMGLPRFVPADLRNLIDVVGLYLRKGELHPLTLRRCPGTS